MNQSPHGSKHKCQASQRDTLYNEVNQSSPVGNDETIDEDDYPAEMQVHFYNKRNEYCEED